MGDYASWDFAEGQEISPGRVMLKALGGGGSFNDTRIQHN